MAEEQLLTDRQVGAIYGIARETVWRWARMHKIPAPVTLGQLSRWRKSEIMEHVGSLKKAEAMERAS